MVQQPSLIHAEQVMDARFRLGMIIQTSWYGDCCRCYRCYRVNMMRQCERTMWEFLPLFLSDNPHVMVHKIICWKDLFVLLSVLGIGCLILALELCIDRPLREPKAVPLWCTSSKWIHPGLCHCLHDVRNGTACSFRKRKGGCSFEETKARVLSGCTYLNWAVQHGEWHCWMASKQGKEAEG